MKLTQTICFLGIACLLFLRVSVVPGQTDNDTPPPEKSVAELLKEGEAKYQKGDILGAIKNYNAVIEKQAYSAIAYQKRARCKRRIQNYPGAIKDYEKAIQLKSELANAYIGKAQTYVAMKNHKKAIKDYARALDLQPPKKYLPLIHYNKGLAHLEIKDYKEAMTDFNKAIELHPKMAKAYLNRGNIYYHFNKSKRACADWIQAKELGNEKAIINLDKICR
ncbi:tetratricopeptide repeat protein [Microscilla marina]|uniref:TPR repeat n=1 Tax=Microscilla marina ATCC 23134 TaxID=313606 RepID=A1ZX93_MICM2|nr:tetratricopeptide repeat protein [Microscilla marina]EAY24967.1 TPR repeat [Microscilla marina ATCC 23134]